MVPTMKTEAKSHILQLPRNPTLDDVVSVTSERRGRRIRITRTDVLLDPCQPCGAWMAIPDEDWIFVSTSAAPFAHNQIVLHELAHMLLGHDDPESDAWKQQFPSFTSDTVKRVVFNRMRYDVESERQAESLASLIHARLVLQPPADWFQPRGPDFSRISNIFMA